MTATVQVKMNRPNYYILIRYKDRNTGKERQKWITTDIPVKGNNKRKAEKRKDEVLAQHLKEKVDIGKDAYFTEFIKHWLETLKKSKNIAITTYDAYSLTLAVHILPYFEPLKLKVKEIEPKHIQAYVNYKLEKISPNTVKKHMANISACLESAVRQNIIAFNPAKRIESIRKVKYTGARYLNEKQIEKLLSCSKEDPLEIVILLTLFYGLRRSEVLGLCWGAIDFKNDTLAIRHTVVKIDKTVHYQDATKNDASNAVLPLPNIIKIHLKKWKAQQAQNKLLQPNDYIDSDYVCTMYNGNPIKPDYVSKHFKLLLAKNGIEHVRFHDLRHSAASYLKYLGFDL